MKGYLQSYKNVLQELSSKLGAINYSSFLPRTATWEPYLDDAHNSICAINYSKENHPVPLLIAMQNILMYCLQHDLHLGRIHLTDKDIYCKLSHPSTCHWVCKVHVFGIIEHSPSVYLMKETPSCRMSLGPCKCCQQRVGRWGVQGSGLTPTLDFALSHFFPLFFDVFAPFMVRLCFLLWGLHLVCLAQFVGNFFFFFIFGFHWSPAL